MYISILYILRSPQQRVSQGLTVLRLRGYPQGALLPCSLPYSMINTEKPKLNHTRLLQSKPPKPRLQLILARRSATLLSTIQSFEFQTACSPPCLPPNPQQPLVNNDQHLIPPRDASREHPTINLKTTMTPKRPATCLLLSVALLATLLFPAPACDSHSHFSAPALASPRRKRESDTGAALTVGVIAAIVIGGIALLVVVVLLILCITKRCANHAQIYQAFADWRTDRNLTSVEIDRRNIGKPVVATTTNEYDGHPSIHPFQTV